MRRYTNERTVQQIDQPKQLHDSATLSHVGRTKCDSATLNREEKVSEKQLFVTENLQPNQQHGSEISSYDERKSIRVKL